MEKLDFLKDHKELKAPHTGIYFGIVGSGSSVSLIESMAVTGTVDGETSITGSDGVTYKTRQFTGNGTFTPTGDGQIQYLIVAGGGGGSGESGAGGAGGYRTNATGEENPNSQALDALLDVTSGTTYTVEVGRGGYAEGTTPNSATTFGGADSWITGSGVPDSGGTNKILANGGGHGQRNASWNNGAGGSGGGGKHWDSPVPASAHMTSPTVQGYPGYRENNSGGGGGGGAGSIGYQDNGGAARQNAILTGSDAWYAGGGGSVDGDGGSSNATGGRGAIMYTRAPTRGVANTGGGGGSKTNAGSDAGNNAAETAGGSGVVIIRWQYAA
tara:strand:- start:273 stop:1256 length:984 start_codon:yes stop_codon:yes gene_type:complete